MSSAPRERLDIRAMGARFVCDVGALVELDIASVDVLVRLQLAARRSGCTVALQAVPPELRELLDLMGLGGLFAVCDPVRDSGREVAGQPEEGEQSPGVQEEGDSRDRPVADLEDLDRPGLEDAGGPRLELTERGRPVRDERDQA